LDQTPGLTVRSPMLGVNLKPNMISRLGAKTPFKGNVTQAGVFDDVGVDIYVEFWRRAGARIGKVQDNGKTIVWESSVESTVNQPSLF
jgi:hypothetical protein